MQEYCISLRNITKKYPGVVALDDVSLDFMPGEVHALMGENGAGKSTLIKAVAGAIKIDAGLIVVNGKEYSEMTPKIASENGIQVIYQELNLVNGMSVMDNVFAGIPPCIYGFLLDTKSMEKQTYEIFERLDVSIDPKALVASLPTAYQQMAEIGKALVRNPKVLVMDEPTSVLSNKEVDILFKAIKRLQAEGVTIIYISHRIEEVFRIADRISVMRDGQYVTTQRIDDIDRTGLIRYMVGREFAENYPGSGAEIGEVMLETKDLSGVGFENVSFKLRRGEILGFAGLVGAGRTEVAHGIIGSTPIYSGEIMVKGVPVHFKSPAEAIRAGIALLPEDRKMQGLVLALSVQMNADIAALDKVSRYGVINSKKDDALLKEYVDKLKIKTPTVKREVQTLSGGNQQKVVLAKWLSSSCDIFIFDEPTRGIDVGAKQEIYRLICELARGGKAILMISSDMEELLGMSDRIVVMCEGRQTGELISRDQFDQHTVLEYASGQS